ncbi:MAG TPA: NAD(P)/FAD-dependent oxidoreductase, partial [Herpetosiphonaceae bacterium]|nr:NAD(P)/FAD-dependent oxidoreductase [Herpetosiphonaceae bacterium]
MIDARLRGAEPAEVVVIGAGAAGLMAGIWAGRTNPDRAIILLDGARTLGAKILVAGGGRCNVTHYHVDARAYA